MTADFLDSIQAAFEREGSRFIVVGGFATIAHGYLRATTDIDIVIDLVPKNIDRAFAALKSIGYSPNLPVSAEEFSDPKKRRSWATDKNMTVLQFYSDRYPAITVDVFVELPFDFEKEWEVAYSQTLLQGQTPIRFASLNTLIAMKEKANRPQDIADLEQLRLIQRESEQQ